MDIGEFYALRTPDPWECVPLRDRLGQLLLFHKSASPERVKALLTAEYYTPYDLNAIETLEVVIEEATVTVKTRQFCSSDVQVTEFEKIRPVTIQ